MNVEERILLERISSLSQLSDEERRIVECDERLLALIADNALLAAMADVHAPEPQRERMFAALETAGNPEENGNMGILKLLNGHGWKTQLAISGLLALGLFVVSQLMPGRDLVPGATPAWASSDGYTIVYDLASGGGFSTSESGLDVAIDSWRAELDKQPEQMAIRVNSGEGRTRLALSTSQVDEAQVQRLVEIIAERTGMHDPQVTGTTLFDNAGHGPSDLLFGEPAHFAFRSEPTLGRIAGLFAGEHAPRTQGAFVHGGGGQIYLGRYSDDAALGQSLGNFFQPEQIASVAEGECRAVGLVSLFGDAARVHAGHAFAAGGDWTDDTGNVFFNGETASAPENGSFFESWIEAIGIGNGKGHGGAIGEVHTSDAAAPNGGAIAWVSSAGGAESTWVAGSAEGNVAWTPAAPGDVEGQHGIFSMAPSPSRFIVLDDSRVGTDAPLPGADCGPEGFTVWAPQPDNASGYSFQVLERSQGNTELLPGYTIFGSTSGMRVFSFPAGSTNADIQQRLDEWYRKNGRRISLKVKVEEPLEDELVLIVAEGVDSDQSLIILGDGTARANPLAAPLPAGDPAPDADAKPAPAPKDH